MRYFKKNAKYRTLCTECFELIESYHKKKQHLALLVGANDYNFTTTMGQTPNRYRKADTDLGRAESRLSESYQLESKKTAILDRRMRKQKVISNFGPKQIALV